MRPSPKPAPAELYARIVRDTVISADYPWGAHQGVISALFLNAETTAVERACAGVFRVTRRVLEHDLTLVFSEFVTDTLRKHPDNPPRALLALMEIYLPGRPGAEYANGDREGLWAGLADIHGRLWWARCERGTTDVKADSCLSADRRPHAPAAIDALWNTARVMGNLAFGLHPPPGVNWLSFQ